MKNKSFLFNSDSYCLTMADKKYWQLDGKDFSGH
jgi:hypothetical protein